MRHANVTDARSILPRDEFGRGVGWVAEQRAGRFVGIGIDVYEGHPRLEHAVAEVTAVAEALSGEFAGEPLLDANEAKIREHLKAVSGCAARGSLVLLWCGHGVASGTRLLLQTSDDRGKVNAADVIAECTQSGANQLLFIIDTCQAGTGVAEASVVASALLEELPHDAEHVWFGILVSCSKDDIGARDGAFGAALLQLLRDGPRSPDKQVRWSRHNRLISGEDLGQAILEDWTGEDQHPDFLRRGSSSYMLPNPLWDEGAPEEVVEHLLRAARGGTSADHRSWFTGREAEVDTVASWVTAGVPGVRVVTGSAGTGKSAVVGRVVSLSNPEERQRLVAAGQWEHADPGERSVAAHVHARGLTVDRMAEELDGQLVRSGVVAQGERGRRNANELIGALQRVADDGGRPPVLVVDGLDEARGETFTIASDLLARLARYASVVVSTRPVTRTEQPTSLLEVLQAEVVLDLDDPARRESGRAAMHGYVVARLSGAAAEMDPAAVADRLVGASSGSGDRPFLLARVVTDQLRATPIDTSMPDWELAWSIESAFDTDLAQVTTPGVGLVPGRSAAGLARSMLTALTWAFGAGFPEEEWLAVASRLADAELGRDHVSWVLDGLGRYVVQDGEDGTAVYRVAHQSLADHLRPPYRRTGERPFDPAAAPVWDALATRYAELLAAGYPSTAPGYLWRYAYRHAAAAGASGLAALRKLAAVDAQLRPDVGSAALEVANLAGSWGRRAEAVAPTEEAVTLYRAQAADNPAYTPDGVAPGELMPDLHVIPGLWTPVTGYDSLLRRLRSLREHGRIGGVLPVAYDWRLSNRYNATRLATIVEPALDRWRAGSPDRAEARLVFVAHSMGGLIARWYIERCGGAELTRKLVTLATPYRGAATAVEQLVNGVHKDIGPLSVDLTAFARSLPSLHQLLPDYACIDTTEALQRLDETTVPELDTTMTADALTFHHDLTTAETARPASLTMTHTIIGVRQPTPTTLRITGTGVQTLDTVGDDNDYGDATVALTGAIGHDLPMDTNTVRRVVDHHGHLQANPWALDELEEALTATPVRRRASATVPARVTVPDLILAGEDLPVTVDIEADPPSAVLIQIVAAGAAGQREHVVASRTPRIRDGRLQTRFTDLAPGGYEVRVTGLNPGSPVTPVTAPILVWTPEPTP